MTDERKANLIRMIHFLYCVGLLAVIGSAYWYESLKSVAIAIGVAQSIAWLIWGCCPLRLWENNYRGWKTRIMSWRCRAAWSAANIFIFLYIYFTKGL
jgi:hypothetical protein